MKLIIDIPKETYKKIQSGEFWLSCGLDLSNSYDYIKNGVPLDKIRAQIEKIELLAVYTRGDIKNMALEIIDKYRAESEEE